MAIQANGFEFDVREHGTGRRAVLLLHGFPQHGGMWDGVARRLAAAGLHTYAPDQRGYSPGARPAEVQAYRMDELVADALALLDALGLDTADVVGHDWGAVVGWHLASSHPDRTGSLTAISVPHPLAMGRAWQTSDEQRRLSSYMTPFAGPVGEAESVLLAADSSLAGSLFAPLSAGQVETYLRPMREPGALTAALNWYRAREAPTIGPARVPVSYLWGEQDFAVGRDAARACADFVAPDVPYRCVELPGLGHWVPDLRPDLVAAEVLRRVDGRQCAPSDAGTAPAGEVAGTGHGRARE